VLYLGGHIGSFDLMAAALGVQIQPLDFIARENKSAAIEQWFYQRRTRLGNGVIPRSGGLRRVLSQLKRGRSVGFLFDQNVTRNNAQFVSWFGRLAATTVAPGLVAERVRCPVVMLSIRYEGDDQYKIHWQELSILYPRASR
jgi:Kdo2-lipid IVA lauroyltransferase/acyltransferase